MLLEEVEEEEDDDDDDGKSARMRGSRKGTRSDLKEAGPAKNSPHTRVNDDTANGDDDDDEEDEDEDEEEEAARVSVG